MIIGVMIDDNDGGSNAMILMICLFVCLID